MVLSIWVNIEASNGLLPVWYQAMTSTNDDSLLIGPTVWAIVLTALVHKILLESN